MFILSEIRWIQLPQCLVLFEIYGNGELLTSVRAKYEILLQLFMVERGGTTNQEQTDSGKRSQEGGNKVIFPCLFLSALVFPKTLQNYLQAYVNKTCEICIRWFNTAFLALMFIHCKDKLILLE